MKPIDIVSMLLCFSYIIGFLIIFMIFNHDKRKHQLDYGDDLSYSELVILSILWPLVLIIVMLIKLTRRFL